MPTEWTEWIEAVFRGRAEHTVDAKGRTSLPARFRDVLAGTGDPRIVLTVGLEPCLVAYPMTEWLAFEERFAKLPQFDPDVARLRRLLIGNAVECEVDRVGRILVPSLLRDHARIDRDVVWVGGVRNLELWARERFLEAMANGPDDVTALARRVSELGL